MAVLGDSGLKPRVPVELADFADPAQRRDWFENRNMLVFQVWHPDDPFCSVDVFIRNPIAFDDLWARSIRANLGDTTCRIASIQDLITMKIEAGRPQDMRDIEELQRLAQLQKDQSS